jgi:hypothetical protein
MLKGMEVVRDLFPSCKYGVTMETSRKENNGYVIVFENIHRSAGGGSSGSEGERRYSACPPPFQQHAYGYLKTT